MNYPFSRRRVLQGGGVLALSAFLAACGGGGNRGQIAAPGQNVGHNDINPKPRDQVRDGGDLRWPLDQLPDNFNNNQFDGTNISDGDILPALLPAMFIGNPDGTLRINPDYLVSAELTSPNPQTVTYTINPKATWSDGTPITWRDFEAQWKALNGTNTAFQIASKTGYENIGSVTRGSDDKQVVVRFARTFAEWKSLFSFLYPASTNSDANTFNTGWINKVPVTAGPFAVAGIDLVAKTMTVKRDPRWWGTPAKLDRIIFKVYERNALADSLANNEIDFYQIGSSVDLFRRAQTIPAVTIREATERTYNHITFNGAAGALLSDVRLRQAIAKGIDRRAITERTIGQIVPNGPLMGNHIYAIGTPQYRDNSGLVPFDPTAAQHELDALGWTRQSAVRARNGQPLAVRFVIDAGNPISDAISKTVLDQLGQIGVQVKIEAVPALSFFKDYVNTGNFDLVGFGWSSTATPFSSSQSIYAQPRGNDIQQNYGRIYSPEIDALFAQGIGELDDAKRAEIGNHIDQLIWQEVHHLPLYPGTGAYAVRSTLANFGAPGLGDVDYINAGFVK